MLCKSSLPPPRPRPPRLGAAAGPAAEPTRTRAADGGMGAWACICRGARRACRVRPAVGRASGGDASDAAPLRRAPAAEAAEAQLPGAGAAACGARPRSGRNGQVARREVRAAKNLCESRAAWIVKEKARGGLADGEIAEPMSVSVRRAHIPWAGHRHAGPSARCAAYHAHGTPVRVPARTQGSRRGGRAARAAQGRRGPPRGSHRAAYGHPHPPRAYARHFGSLRGGKGRGLPQEEGVGEAGVRPLEHDAAHGHCAAAAGRWPASYEDDARAVAAFRVVMGAASANATAALHEAMGWHGRPVSIMTDRGSWFLANEAEGRRARGGGGGQPSSQSSCARTRGTSWPGPLIPGRTA